GYIIFPSTTLFRSPRRGRGDAGAARPGRARRGWRLVLATGWRGRDGPRCRRRVLPARRRAGTRCHRLLVAARGRGRDRGRRAGAAGRRGPVGPRRAVPPAQVGATVGIGVPAWLHSRTVANAGRPRSAAGSCPISLSCVVTAACGCGVPQREPPPPPPGQPFRRPA